MKNKKVIIIVVSVLLVLGILIGIVAGSYNGLVDQKENVDNKRAQIETNLQRRADLIPNLVETVKGYAQHEDKVFTELANARAKMSGAKTTEELQNANNALDSAISRLLVVVENYPDLKADKEFTTLMDELSGTENRISVARKDYNDAVTNYNKSIKKFPKLIFAKMFGFEAEQYFEATDNAQNAPSVKF